LIDVAAQATVHKSKAQMVWTAFVHLLWRDLWVTVREWKAFLAQTLLQPVFFLFIFGSVLPRLGQTTGTYSVMLLPGIIALTTLLTAMQSVSIPLAIEFGYTKEIEDRLLAPLPVSMVAVEKMVFASIRGLLTGALIIPLGRLILGSGFAVSLNHPLLLPLVAMLAALEGAAVGLTMGTIIQPNQIGLMFSLILTPILFTGCVYYPWALLDRLRWFQVVTLFSPLTYASEGFRASLVPQAPHMPAPAIIGGQIAFLIFFSYMGVRGFLKRAID